MTDTADVEKTFIELGGPTVPQTPLHHSYVTTSTPYPADDMEKELERALAKVAQLQQRMQNQRPTTCK